MNIKEAIEHPWLENKDVRNFDKKDKDAKKNSFAIYANANEDNSGTSFPSFNSGDIVIKVNYISYR